ncbi:MAG: alpha-amylase [Anaerolineae bacterium]|nr:alpha-amylase [Anaerolineae bacterium]
MSDNSTTGWNVPADYFREFHVSREARDLYQFDESLFSLRGTVVIPNFRAARQFADQMNERRDLVRFPEQAVKAGQINAMALIHEILHLMIVTYRQQTNPGALRDALEHLDETLSAEPVETTLTEFVDDFPAQTVYKGEITVPDYLASDTAGDPNPQVSLEEMLLLWLSNTNPAFEPYRELFDDTPLERDTEYERMIGELRQFFASQPGFGEGNVSLMDMLEAPAKASPYSLEGQLEFIRQNWAQFLGKHIFRLLAGLDLIAEEEKPVFFGPGPSEAPDFGHLTVEPERFSPDRDWMPKVVMMAKNAYVWLDQLSRKYGMELRYLNQIPDEELDFLAQGGFTGLWLIGLWERSTASRTIKQMMGNPEAVASAYSLYDYEIAADLGGWLAYKDLRDRAWARGIRLASDMVPNHVGIDGKWVMEHPDWFVQLPYSPFPSYSFNGPNLSQDERVGIYLEDHYYSRSDAAVVFQRRDHWTGDTRFIYHGNDGTSMPWNDTAQLNYLNPEVREAVIQTILHVARMFPIIRFDAAMTLAKRHFHRLWFPEPGSGGDIASRAEYGLTQAEFDAAFPEEFWREVVDRVAAEVPDTLLLAEAFWLMEGYFVRTLGMHRVYNSAFMNMLKKEENAKYRSVIKNTVEFDPEILKRYVNFMNNPDEDTAVAQFGKDDKYFGVATMLATMPGLPMFGHGQIEGFTEKYGMEYRRAYYDETPDGWLVSRHQREIFPLLHKRYLFAEVDNFRLYDFFSAEGGVNEDVFAYSNHSGDERALVIFHNKWADARGWIRTSAAYAVKEADGNKRLEQTDLANGLGLPNDPNAYVIFRDVASNLEYIRNCKQLHEEGMYVELGAFKYHVFLDYRIVHEDIDGSYGHLMGYLAGRGVPSIEEALAEIFLQPVLDPFRKLVNSDTLGALTEVVMPVAVEMAEVTVEEEDGDELAELDVEIVVEADLESPDVQVLLDDVQARYQTLLQAVADFAEGEGDVAALAAENRDGLETLLSLPDLAEQMPELEQVAASIAAQLGGGEMVWATALSWHFVHNLGAAVDTDEAAELSRSWLDEWLLGRLIGSVLRDMTATGGAADEAVAVVKLLTANGRWFDARTASQRTPLAVLSKLLRSREVQQFIRVNRYGGVLYFNKEAYEQLCAWLLLPAVVDSLANLPEEDAVEQIVERHAVLQKLLEASAESGYQVDKLLEGVR